jgi:glucose-6-phosphate 1-epimerase
VNGAQGVGMTAPATRQPETLGGLACWRLRLAGGDSVLVSEHGAQVLSWQAGGAERLYLSRRALLDGRGAIRGGVPVCWPQFSDRGPLPKHGVVRQRRWTPAEPSAPTGDEGRLDLGIVLDPGEPPGWLSAAAVTLSVLLRPGALQVSLTVRNTGPAPLEFTGALHTYLAVGDIEAVALHGLAGRTGWDALTGASGPAAEPTRFSSEFDRAYGPPATDLVVDDGRDRVRVRQGGGWCDTVVWNPWSGKAATLADLPADGWRHMLCVEAARAFEPAVVAPGADWSGWQALEVGG